jgi:hypothetical protein
MGTQFVELEGGSFKFLVDYFGGFFKEHLKE